ncbi:kinase-like domain-containing protein [Abortiporus biennis]|nr:kinase-like domain-containing protein [Abortiporus biennis]
MAKETQPRQFLRAYSPCPTQPSDNKRKEPEPSDVQENPERPNKQPRTTTSTELDRPSERRAFLPARRSGPVKKKLVDPKDIEVWQNLGEGAFGRVVAARLYKNEQDPMVGMYAMKMIPKRNVRSLEWRWGLSPRQRNAERRALVDLAWHPFIVGLVDAFVDNVNLYQVLELGACGCLTDRIEAEGKLSTDATRFYLSNILLGLEFLHSNGLVHRDLKPDNIIIGADGYCMIGDLGCSEHYEAEGLWYHVGTPHYLSPEAAKGTVKRDERMAPDWWAFGLMVFELATGRLPPKINSKESKRTAYKGIIVREWTEKDIKVVDPLIKDLYDLMCDPIVEVKLRLGAEVKIHVDGRPWFNHELRTHEFFKKVNFKNIMEKRELPPWLPPIAPDLTQMYHEGGQSMPFRFENLKLANVPKHLQRDDRIILNRWPTQAQLDRLVPK